MNKPKEGLVRPTEYFPQPSERQDLNCYKLKYSLYRLVTAVDISLAALVFIRKVDASGRFRRGFIFQRKITK